MQCGVKTLGFRVKNLLLILPLPLTDSVVLRLGAPPRPEAWPEQGPAGPGLAGAGLRAV